MGITMKKQSLILLLAMSFISSFVFAQELPLTNKAAQLCQDKNLDAAVEKINEAIKSVEANQPYAWYVKGFIYKEVYKQNELNNRNSKNREVAVESFLKALEMDKKREHSEMTKAGIKYLATTYYNDALLRTRDFDLTTAAEAETLFNDFRRLMRTVDPVFAMKTYEKEFSKSMAQRYFMLWQLDYDNDEVSEKALAQYGNALRADSLDGDTHYNIAAIYYNRAVFKYRQLNADTDIFDLVNIQQECANLIKNRALVHMNKAYEIIPERGDVVRGLMFIHRALEHENDVEYFKSEIERLISEGKITAPSNTE